MLIIISSDHPDAFAVSSSFSVLEVFSKARMLSVMPTAAFLSTATHPTFPTGSRVAVRVCLAELCVGFGHKFQVFLVLYVIAWQWLGIFLLLRRLNKVFLSFN